MAGETRVAISDLWKRYTVWHDRPTSFKSAILRTVTKAVSDKEEFWALRDVSLQVQGGEAVGLIGPNGSGKSTLLGVIGKVLKPTRGTVEVDGRVSILMEAGVGFHPDLTGIENIYLSGALLGMKRRDIHSRIDRIIDFAEINDFIDTPVRMLSSGMFMRLGFSVAVHLDPDIMLVDEVLAVGDEKFHHKCRAVLNEYRNNGGAIIFVSHRLHEVRWLCDRVIWLAKGEIFDEGDTDRVLDAYIAGNAANNNDVAFHDD